MIGRSELFILNEQDIEGLIKFMRLAAQLKAVRRQGWVDRGVGDPESSADHSWAVAIFAWALASEREGLDPTRVMLLALLHDLPEALAGDATPFDRYRGADGMITSEHFHGSPTYDDLESHQKHQREREALQEMIAGLPGQLSERIVDAWEEYTAGTTAESQFVRQVDKLETLLQAELYREQQREVVIESFRTGTDRDVSDPILRRVLEGIIDRRMKSRG
ncbi:HD domain-containing protein [soil metagenome]